MSAAARPAVVFLARGVDGGLSSPKRFLASYARHPAGAPHDLIVLRKGFRSEADAAALAALADAHGARVLDLPDDGFDLGAYFRCAEALSHRRLLFINTHSEILASGWLADFLTAAEAPALGMVGATGSWQARPFSREMAAMFTRYVAENRTRLHGLAEAVQQYGRVAFDRLRPRFRHFHGFPNPHLRSNAFLIRREDMLAFAALHRLPRDKEEALRLESGKRGLTRYLAARGLGALVVAAGGEGFEAASWDRSGTYRVPDQPRLLVADNVTREYMGFNAWQRRGMELMTWGRCITEPAPQGETEAARA
jgi:hypothetical protein